MPDEQDNIPPEYMGTMEENSENSSSPPPQNYAPTASNQNSGEVTGASIWEDVKNKVTLEEYFGEYLKINLQPAGGGQFMGLCPFHDEKTPSFRIYPDGQFHCFGCEKSGTIIDAVMYKENFVEPIDAVQWLNKEFALGLNQNSKAYEAFKTKVDQSKKESDKAEKALWDISSNLASQAREYLKKRKYSKETIQHFQLGVDSDSGGRISIPIKDKGNHIITISKRSIWDTWKCKECDHINQAKEVFVVKQNGGDPTKCLNCGKKTLPTFFVYQFPKYRNETKSKKSIVLYNEPEAKRNMLDKEKNDPLLIMEGYADVWACYEAGFTSAVSYNGAQISSAQASQAVKLISQAKSATKRANKYILLVPDFDETGRISLSKNISQIRQVNKDVEIKVLHGVDEYTWKDPITGNERICKDLGEVLQHHGKDVLHKIITDNRMSADEYRIREVLNYEHHSKEMQIQLIRGILGEVQHAIELDHLVPDISEQWDVEESEVKRFLYAEIANKEAGVGLDLISTVADAHEAAVEYLKDGFTIKTGLPTIDHCLPGGGFRLRQLSLWLGKSGVGKTNLCLNLIRNMSQYQGLPVVFFSLEQPKAQLYMRLVQMILAVDSDTAHDLVRNDVKEELEKVDKALENLIIVDGVPSEGNERPEMTPATIAHFIQEINLVRFSKPATAIFIDHLGICKPGESAPGNVKNDENALAGYLMEEFFSVCKETNTFFIVLQQLPKEVRPGKEFSYDAGRGGSRQTDFSDYIFCIWRPEQDEDLDEEGKIAVEGQYKLKLGKNRHGMSNTATCIFDWKSLSIEEGASLNNHIGASNDTKDLVDELVGEVGGDSIGMPEVEDHGGAPSWFDT